MAHVCEVKLIVNPLWRALRRKAPNETVEFLALDLAGVVFVNRVEGALDPDTHKCIHRHT